MDHTIPGRLHQFWKEVYVAAIRASNGTRDATQMADDAVAAFLLREQ